MLQHITEMLNTNIISILHRYFTFLGLRQICCRYGNSQNLPKFCVKRHFIRSYEHDYQHHFAQTASCSCSSTRMVLSTKWMCCCSLMVLGVHYLMYHSPQLCKFSEDSVRYRPYPPCDYCDPTKMKLRYKIDMIFAFSSSNNFFLHNISAKISLGFCGCKWNSAEELYVCIYNRSSISTHKMTNNSS